MRVLDSIKAAIGNKSSVQMVADDRHLASEILLLVRMMYIDGELQGAELELFKQFCSTTFDIPEADVPDVIKFLREYGYETSGEQAAAIFSDMPQERKVQLIQHMVTMAQADDVLHDNEVDLIARVSRVLGFSPQQVLDFVKPS